MIYSRKRHFIFLQVPRTACRATEFYLRKSLGGRRVSSKYIHDTQIPREYKSFFKFATVRNPCNAETRVDPPFFPLDKRPNIE